MMDAVVEVARSRDVAAFGATSLLMVLFVETVKSAASRRIISTPVARKCMHVGAGPIFILTWPLFSRGGAAIASLVPLAMTVKFALTGMGLLHNEAEVKSMSRSGDPRELLRGPVLYGLTFVVVTLARWRSVHGVAAMMALCLGDGMAEVFGRRFGSFPPGHHPWSPRKSWAGTGAFVLSSFLGSALFAALFHALGWAELPRLPALGQIALACVAGAMVESLPWEDVDNVFVPLAVLLVLKSIDPQGALLRAPEGL